MTPPIVWLDGPWWPLLALLLFAVLPTEIWRWLAIVFARRIDPASPLLEWVRAVATALLAGVVAKIVTAPPGALASTPFALRVGALALAVGVVLVNRRRLLPAVLAGEALLIGGSMLLG